jgi:hypothetical protein
MAATIGKQLDFSTAAAQVKMVGVRRKTVKRYCVFESVPKPQSSLAN